MEEAIDALETTRDAVPDVKTILVGSDEYLEQSNVLQSLLSEVGTCATRLGVSTAIFSLDWL